MLCHNCNAAIGDTEAFCPYCGARAIVPAVQPALPKKKSHAVVIAAAIVLVICVGAVLFYELGSKNKQADSGIGTVAADAVMERESKKSGNVSREPKKTERDTAPPSDRAVEPDNPETVTPEAAAESATPDPAPTEATPEPEPPVIPARDFIISDSATRLLGESELAQYSNVELVLARNEIFARHGRMFSSKLLNEYFLSKSWYTPRYSPDSFPGGLLSKVENDNVSLLLSYRDGRATGGLTYQGTGAADLDAYQVFADSDKRHLTVPEVRALTADDLEIAIYEIYARRGMIFDSPKWLEYFKSFTWYKMTVPESRWSDDVLSDFERSNLDLLKASQQS